MWQKKKKNRHRLHSRIRSPSMVTSRTFRGAPWSAEADLNHHQLKESSTATLMVHKFNCRCAKNVFIKRSKILSLSGD